MKLKRIIGNYAGDEPGATVIFIGGMHGNELSGVLALQHVFQTLTKLKPTFKGEFLALSGNLKAIYKKERFIQRDLNRMWFRTGNNGTLMEVEPGPEKEEFDAINQIIFEKTKARKGPLIFVDLHTTSAESPPFVLIGDTLRNREFVKVFPVPVILGLEEQLDGPLLSYLNELGHIAFGFEGGQHNDPKAMENHLGLIWMVLLRAGCLDQKAIPNYGRQFLRMEERTKGLNDFYEVRHRHGIQKGEAFTMQPGFSNFQSVNKNQVLANNVKGEIKAGENGYVFMPLYQEQGDDGYFLIKEVNPSWMRISASLRRMKLDRLLPLLPGVNRISGQRDMLAVNTKIARFYGLAIFHLFGFRKVRVTEGKRLVMVRRAFDFDEPEFHKSSTDSEKQPV